MNRVFDLVASAACAAILAASVQTVQADTTPLDSSAFTYKYEMDILPSAANLNGDSAYDFDRGGAGTIGVADGILTGTTGASEDGYLISGNIWTGRFTKASGYTVEARVKVASQVPGKVGATAIDVGVASSPAAELAIGASGVVWMGVPGDGTAQTVLASDIDNTSDFHTYRISQVAATDMFLVWRDNTLLTPTALTGGQGIWDQLYFVDGGGNFAGSSQYDYVRFTSGTYAPVPEPSSMAILIAAMVGLVAYAWRKRK
jgi:hypothetical protein